MVLTTTSPRDVTAQCAGATCRFASICPAFPADGSVPRDLDTAAGEPASQLILLSAGDSLPPEYSTGEEMISVVEGVIVLHKSLAPKKRQVFGFKFPGDRFLLTQVRSYFALAVQAVSPATLCRINIDRFTDVEEGHEFCRMLFGLYKNDLAYATEGMLKLGQMSALQRVASFVAEIADRCGRYVSGHIEVPLPMNRTDISDYLGLEVETVSRTLGRLKSMGIIEVRKPDLIHVADMDALTEVAVSYPLRQTSSSLARH